MTSTDASQDAVPGGPRRRRRGLRIAVWVALALFVVAVAGWAVLVRPNRAAIAFLQRLSRPADAAAATDRGARMLPADGARPACLVLAGRAPDAPVVVAVAGLTREGVADARVARLVVALHDAGFSVVAPDLPGLRAPGDDDRLVDPVVRTWAAALEGRLGLPPTPSVALFGVSLGGGLVVRAAARRAPGDPPAGSVSAMLLVGPPDDATTLAKAWFAEPLAAAGAGATETARSEAGAFARHGIARAALPSVVPAAEHQVSKRWIDAVGDGDAGAAAAPPVESEAARAWVAATRAEHRATPAQVDLLVSGAGAFLAAVSPASADAASLARLAAPTYVVHGVADPLVPVAESRRLAARLVGARVGVLESRVVAHVEVASPGLAETWRHVTFIQSFFDDARGSR
jgi:pimeloyl-ACP methyl ester carboxylesterase